LVTHGRTECFIQCHVAKSSIARPLGRRHFALGRGDSFATSSSRPTKSLVHDTIASTATPRPLHGHDSRPLATGNALIKWMVSRPERFAVLLSGYLSHTHHADGPYGDNHASQEFDRDRAIGAWAASPCGGPEHVVALSTAAAELQPKALSCGFTGFVVLQGMLCMLCSVSQTKVLSSNNCDRWTDGTPASTGSKPKRYCTYWRA
jgi:hypothetical protein